MGTRGLALKTSSSVWFVSQRRISPTRGQTERRSHGATPPRSGLAAMTLP
jgi:hypothetical protein